MAEPIVLDPKDDVAILTAKAGAGDDPLGLGTSLDASVAQGHKVARHGLAKGAAIRKFGQIIGYATADISAGEHVHSHNCAIGDHDRGYEIGADLEAAKAAVAPQKPMTFQGYRREDGRVGTRNYIALCATVNCSATVIRKAAD
ncbi:MAG: UxaA family hydrolase, partial [Pseudomonadota bacterium]|nr:UxaA family hydrolase [Pseudomonadota bacterium]